MNPIESLLLILLFDDNINGVSQIGGWSSINEWRLSAAGRHLEIAETDRRWLQGELDKLRHEDRSGPGGGVAKWGNS